MREKYDLIVVGAGSGGLNIGVFMRRAGFKVLLVSRTAGEIGGDCLNTGCVPSKALIHVSKLVHNARESKKFGLRESGKINMKKVKDYIKSKQEVIRVQENAEHFRRMGIDVAMGEANFVSKNSVKIGEKVYEGRKIVLATGSRPKKLKVQGIEKVKHLTNENIFDLEKLPEKLLIVGGGPIGIELAQAFQRLGSKVTILERGGKFLPKEDPEIAGLLLKQLEKEGVNVKFNVSPDRFVSFKDIIIKNKKEGEERIRFDEILISIGRELNVEGLDLKKAEIELENGKIKHDNYLRTTNKNVLLSGDVVGSLQFTHAAELHASVIIHNFFSPFKKKFNNDKMSWVTYTYPEIATFGLNEKQLKERSIKYEKLEADLKEDDRSIVDDFTEGKLKIYASKDRILGGTLIAPNAGEIVQELILAMSSRVRIKEIFGKIYPYPTASRINKRAVSLHFSKKLTGFNKKVLGFLYGKF